MRRSILFVIAALAFGCGGKQDNAETTPDPTANPSGAEGVSPPPMAGEEMQGQEMPSPDDTEGAEGEGTPDPDM